MDIVRPFPVSHVFWLIPLASGAKQIADRIVAIASGNFRVRPLLQAIVFAWDVRLARINMDPEYVWKRELGSIRWRHI